MILKITFGPYYNILDHIIQYWTILDNFGPFWIIVYHLRPTLTMLDYFEHFLGDLNTFRKFWTICLPCWASLDLFGPV